MFAVLTFKNTDMQTQLEYYIATRKELDNIFKNIRNFSGFNLKTFTEQLLIQKPIKRELDFGLSTLK